MGTWGSALRSVLLAGAASVLAVGAAQAQQAAAEDGEPTGANSLALGRVVVSAGEDKVAIDTPQAVTALDQEDLERTQPSTIADMIEDIPSVSAEGGVSALGQGFNIRGLGTGLADSDSRILFQVDGVTKFYEQYRMGALFSEPDLYRRVEVLRGPASSTLYGAGALAGVVNFTTRDTSDFLADENDRFALRLRGGYESNAEGGFGTAIAAFRPVANLDVLAFANVREQNDYENGDGDTVIPSNVTSNTALLKGRYYFGGDRGHNIFASYQWWNSDSPQLYDQAEAASSITVRRNVTDTTALIGYENDFSANDLLDFRAQFSFANSDVEQTETTFLSSGGVPFDYSQFTYATWQSRVENTSEFSLGQEWTLFVTVGAQHSFQERRNSRVLPSGVTIPGTTTHPEGDMTRIGVFAQAEIVWGDKLTIIPGVRWDRSEFEPGDGVPTTTEFERDGASPKIAALYNVTDWFGVFGSFSHTIRLPVIDEIYSRSSTQTVSLNLEPEESDNSELGFTLSFDDVFAESDVFRFKLTGFHNEVTNLIVRGVGPGVPYFRNVGESTLEGYEIEAEYGAERFFGRLGFSSIEGTDELTGLPLNTIPADELTLMLGYLVPQWDLTVGWRGLFAADQNDVPGTAFTRPATPGYSVHNLFATWRPDEGALEGVELRLAVDNLADEQYQPHLWSLDAPGRAFKIALARTF
jgi:hemoglobin/transferrin/lactoferrin receptor protein